MTEAAPLLVVDGLEVRIPTKNGVVHAVNGVSFTVEQGKTLAIVGESGCGKSLTAMSLLGLNPPNVHVDARRLAFDGLSMLGQTERDWRSIRGRQISVIFQDPMTALDPVHRIGTQMLEILRRHRPMKREAARQHVLEALRSVGVTMPEQRLAQYPHQLSGGLRQRVMIAIAMLCQPRLIVADEPTTALDVTMQAQILAVLRDMIARSGTSMVIITHDLGVVADIADTVVVMYGGQVVEHGTVDQILERPCHPYTRGLIRSIPVLGEASRGEPLGSIPGTVETAYHPPVGCVFAARCEFAEDACRSGPIAMRTASPEHYHRCRKAEVQGEGALT